jgi:hypothetical protein
MAPRTPTHRRHHTYWFDWVAPGGRNAVTRYGGENPDTVITKLTEMHNDPNREITGRSQTIVWDIMENAYVTLEHWNHLNNKRSNHGR